MIKLKPLLEWKRYSIPHTDSYIQQKRAMASDFRSAGRGIDPWRGPHEGAVADLMIMGRKPAAIINLPEDKKELEPYIKSGKLIAKEVSYNRMVVAQPTEKKRLDAIIKLLKIPVAGRKSLPPIYHAKLGILLGYSKDDILKFLDSQKKRYDQA